NPSRISGEESPKDRPFEVGNMGENHASGWVPQSRNGFDRIENVLWRVYHGEWMDTRLRK
ncbi:MAG: hypothetical protein OSJ51_11905, partial [Parabacteroides distasonis]|nr:hypothetical protein [Parabacteroides distasonis]